MASTRSLLTEQHMQPLLSCTMSSLAAMISSPSIPISPVSLTMTAILSPCSLPRIWFSSVVLPLPRKPAITVTGKRARSSAGFIGSEGVGGADGRLADRFTKCIGEGVQSAPAGAMSGDDVFDAERPQAFDGIGNDRSHHAVDRKIREQLPHLGADIDDPGMRAGTEHDQSQVAHMDHEHALIHQKRIRLPCGIRASSTEMVDAAFLKGSDPRDLAAVIEMAIEQQPLFAAIHDGGAALLQFGRRRDFCNRYYGATLQPDTAFVEHVRIDMYGHPSPVPDDCVYGGRQSRHVIPMSVAHSNTLDLAHRDAEISAIAYENGSFRPSIKQQHMPHAAELRHQAQAVAEIPAQQHLAGDRFRPGANDIGEL